MTVLHAKDDSESQLTRAQEYEHIRDLCARFSAPQPNSDATCYYQDFGSFEFRWESHTEFSTYTFIHHVESAPFERTGISPLPEEWLAGLPGKVISGLHIDIEAPPEKIDIESLRGHFEGHRLISSFVHEKRAQIWTSYRIHSDNMGRFLIFNHDLNPCQTGRLVRRILELETYRMMALLAFPIAKEIAPKIRGMNLELAGIITQIDAIEDLEDERRMMSLLTELSANIEKVISDTHYRFSATEAYYRIAKSRIAELEETEVCGLQTLDEFLTRRLKPAYFTCDTVSKDLDELSSRIDRASELLRTRMNLTIESQNQRLLQSMNHRGKLQLRMQQAVEGLSVAAISYYLVGLVKYAAESAKAVGVIDSSYLIVGFAVPICIATAVLGLRRIKKSILRESKT
ncbi:hypothetical protein A3742_08000 [Oleiphilus sp. HI0071]|nr:hypothetical protein A3737_10895 [Oleiphilus sp. HI0065]KZY82817.1 hypothetical protein A3742_08000 [Oleiphilus sp. HI0071]KZZ04871.1 hypothetical protein A3744_09370 [Oleiphilus sp. HI0073]KZZ14093.1 hypothetical protein A3750_15600 [Oleiphilus sp. HI0079]KZZ19976.1 hypothetical protein A3751_00700 [Oleiphilus sp. HI0080]KZZ43825.1 hypothetical protein A3758_04380 [Oleiphilus sp. HI0118]KZZ56663.1 hypothetical protein A3760_08460 [Oleiphilus sp. HI0122]KZZ65591.1 hypothetical protein A37